jgi:tRNA A37 methylthiotransferase MiaB
VPTKPTYRIDTLGCKANVYDSRRLAEALEAIGFRQARDGRCPDVCLVNTCTVTATADRKARQRAAHLVRQHPHARVFVTGCYATAAAHEAAAIPGIAGAYGRDQWPDLLAALGNGGPPPAQELLRGDFGIRSFGNRTRAFLKVQEGCDSACSYCILPRVRGKPRSCPLPQVRAEAERLAAAGLREIVLTGIHLGFYGKDLRASNRTPREPRCASQRMDARKGDEAVPGSGTLRSPDAADAAGSRNPQGRGILRHIPVSRRLDASDPLCAGARAPWPAAESAPSRPRVVLLEALSGRVSLADAVAAVAETPGVERVRLSSLEALEVDRALLRAMEHPNVCPHLHLPLQSGDAGVLAQMNRRYSPDQFLRAVALARRHLDRPAITTDVMIGFPGETEEQFDNTLSVCRAARFSRIHIFPFSPRPGTVAAQMPDRVPPGIVRERCRRLRVLADQMAADWATGFVGQAVPVLFEGRTRAGMLSGYTDRYVRVHAEGEPALKGRIASVLCTGSRGAILVGTVPGYGDSSA